MGPYGTVLALTWDRESSGRVTVVALGGDPGRIEADWEVPGAEAPHDLALAAAPLSASGVGERLLAVLVAETRPAGSRLLKFVVAPQGARAARCALRAGICALRLGCWLSGGAGA